MQARPVCSTALSAASGCNSTFIVVSWRCTSVQLGTIRVGTGYVSNLDVDSIEKSTGPNDTQALLEDSLLWVVRGSCPYFDSSCSHLVAVRLILR